jgi:hypothetical protein
MPNFDMHEIFRRASEHDRDMLLGERGWEVIAPSPYGMLSDPWAYRSQMQLYPAHANLATWRRHANALEWVRRSCEQDRLPVWLIEMVLERVKDALVANDWPIVIQESERYREHY